MTFGSLVPSPKRPYISERLQEFRAGGAGTVMRVKLA